MAQVVGGAGSMYGSECTGKKKRDSQPSFYIIESGAVLREIMQSDQMQSDQMVIGFIIRCVFKP